MECLHSNGCFHESDFLSYAQSSCFCPLQQLMNFVTVAGRTFACQEFRMIILVSLPLVCIVSHC